MRAYRERTISAPGHQGETVAFSPVVAPPSEIGELASWSVDIGTDGPTEARRASLRRARGGRLWLGFIGGAGGFLIATLKLGSTLGAAVGVLAALGGYGIAGWLIRGPQTTFVGADGVARFRHRARDVVETLRFRDVKALRVSHAIGRQSVVFSYSFELDRGAFRIVGAYPLTSTGTPDAQGDHPFWFALAAEQAYTQFRLPKALATIAEGNEVRFAVTKREAITLSQAGIQLEPARGGVFRSVWRHAVMPRVNGAMVEFLAPRAHTKQLVADTENPFAAPDANNERETVIFRGSELPDYALLVALIEAKIDEARNVPAVSAVG